MKLWNNSRQRWLKASMDRSTNALSILDYAHHEIHDGNSWHIYDTSADMSAQVENALEIQFTTPAASVGLVHAIFGGYVGAAWLFDLREGQTAGGANGAAIVTEVNRRRGSGDGVASHGMTFLKDSEVGTGGTVLMSKNYGSGSGPFAEGGTAREINEWVLAAATIYQVRALSDNAVAGNLYMDFYLHVDKDTI
ncbi:MAG: hypothetical protein ACERKJ_12200 [Candidatus Dadabacteria bacterium]